MKSNCALAFLLCLTCSAIVGEILADDVGTTKRILWTTSRVVGSPDPPLPFDAKKLFPNLEFKSPIYVIPEPGSNSLLVVLAGDDRRIVKFENKEDVNDAKEWYRSDWLIYGLTFDDEYLVNGYVYLFTNGAKEGRRHNQITRYHVNRAEPFELDRNSALMIVDWASAGHDGGDLAFGNDGMLYITSGDGTSDSDGLVSGQDVSNLLATLIRIDVKNATKEDPYRVPSDNPFLETKNARPEIWAFGFRNPWRMSIDRPSGQIWVGNNGQDLWETAHLVRRGENYGWSVYEGNHPFYLNRRLGPAEFVPPTVEHHHREARSLTGGVVYRGSRLKELDGTYIYGDYSTGKIWGVKHDGEKIETHQLLADTTLQIAAFRVDQQQRLLVVDHGGSIFELVPNVQEAADQPFPAQLSETGLFESVAQHQVHAGVIPYSVTSEMWADGATMQRWLGIPGENRIDFQRQDAWGLPEGSVVLQTLSLETEVGNSKSAKRIESRILTKQQNEWAGYSYRWNEEQTDAALVKDEGEDVILTRRAADSSTMEHQWRFPSRAECMVCHSRAANYLLGITTRQLQRDVHEKDNETSLNQLEMFRKMGLFSDEIPLQNIEREARFVNPYDVNADLKHRARTYLDTNCACCHMEAGGGNSKINLKFSAALDATQLVYGRPQHQSFGIDNAMLVMPGDPDRSVLLTRLSRRTPGQMPPLVSTHVDHRATALIRNWIQTMNPTKTFVKDWRVHDLASDIKTMRSRSFEKGRDTFHSAGCLQCHRLQDSGGDVGPDLSEMAKRLTSEKILEAIIEPSREIQEAYANTRVVTLDGIVVSGRIEKETDEMLVVRPETSRHETVTIAKADIESRSLSDTSAMPTGTINTLTKSEILDLMAYLVSGASSDHQLFSPENPAANATIE